MTTKESWSWGNLLAPALDKLLFSDYIVPEKLTAFIL